MDRFAAALNEFDFSWPGSPIIPSHTDVTLELDDEFVAAKVEALRQHASQMEPLFDSTVTDSSAR
jgi:LmbE family N-acetylglucosaminyl deacetylase